MEWIDVNEQLPRPYQSVLIFRPEEGADEDQIWFGYHTGKKWMSDYDSELDNLEIGGVISPNKVTHWMPLPSPPK